MAIRIAVDILQPDGLKRAVELIDEAYVGQALPRKAQLPLESNISLTSQG